MNNVSTPFHLALCTPSSRYLKWAALTTGHGNKLHGTSSQNKNNGRNAASMIYCSLETLRFELQPPTGLEGAIAEIGESPPIVLELELFHNIANLEPNNV